MTAQNEPSQLGGGAAESHSGASGGSSGKRGKASQIQQQSSNQRASHQTGGQRSNIKAETIKSLERAQLKNQLNKVAALTKHLKLGAGGDRSGETSNANTARLAN